MNPKTPRRKDRVAGKIEIPVRQIDIGLGLCAKNIRRFVEDVDILLQNSSVLHATALAIFAAEELVKYSELRKAKISATDPNGKVDGRLFWDHHYKQELVKELLPKGTLILSPAYFDPKYFDSKFYQTGDIEASQTLRLDCVFVNWKETGWVYGSTVQVGRLRQFTQSILDVLSKLESGPP